MRLKKTSCILALIIALAALTGIAALAASEEAALLPEEEQLVYDVFWLEGHDPAEAVDLGSSAFSEINKEFFSPGDVGSFAASDVYDELTETQIPRGPDAFGEIDAEALRAAIYPSLLQGAERIDIKDWNICLTTDGEILDFLQTIFAPLLNSCPELLFVENRMGTARVQSTGLVVYLIPYYVEELAQPEVMQEIEAAAQYILSTTLQPDMTDLEKALALHDYLILNCQYDWVVANYGGTGTGNVHNIYGSLVEGNAVCDGYALAYQFLLQRAGVNAGVITSPGHMWNWVELDGKYYHVDVTWDDPVHYTVQDGSFLNLDRPGYVTHKYFMVDNETLLALDAAEGSTDHTPEWPLPEGLFADETYLSGYLFNNNDAPFFWHSGTMYYFDGAKGLAYAAAGGDLKGTAANTPDTAERWANTWTWLANRCGDQLYYMQNGELYQWQNGDQVSMGMDMYSALQVLYCQDLNCPQAEPVAYQAEDAALLQQLTNYSLSRTPWSICVDDHENWTSAVEQPVNAAVVGTPLEVEVYFGQVEQAEADTGEITVGLAWYGSEAQAFQILVAAYAEDRMIGLEECFVTLETGEKCPLLLENNAWRDADTLKIFTLAEGTLAPLTTIREIN